MTEIGNKECSQTARLGFLDFLSVHFFGEQLSVDPPTLGNTISLPVFLISNSGAERA